MGNCLSTPHTNPRAHPPSLDAAITANSAATAPSAAPTPPISPLSAEGPTTSAAPVPEAAPPPPISLPSPAGPSNAPYKVFISHAGEDKVTIAIPLREKLRKRGITAFVDKKDMLAGMEATPAMIHAMQTASVGVFVMSPEFVARKWPMKELMHFLARRDERKGAGFEGPLIIPLFYRLSIRELYDEPRLDRNDKGGNNLYEKSRFYERQRNGEPEANIAEIKAVLTRLHDCMGVENVANASNDSRYEMYLKREMILDMLCNKICEAVPTSTFDIAVTEHASEAERDTFQPHFDKAYDVSELVFDFERKDGDGNVCTQEGKILGMVLDRSVERNRAIAVRGIGGVGKTSLLRKIRNLDCVCKRFKDGVYCLELGKDATRGGLIEALISIVLKSGGKQTAKNMRTETDVRKVIEALRSWFSQKQCLFLIDDVWNTKEVTRGIIRGLWNLHTSGRDSKILLTTRSIDIATYGRVYVSLMPRKPLEDESRVILYHYAGLHPSQGHNEDNRAMDEILERCAGLPLFLSVAGKGVKTLSFRPGHEGCMACRIYCDQLKTSMGEMITTETESYEGLSARLKISIELVEERKERFDFELSGSMAEMHRRLSVMKKQMRVPMSMLKHLWEVEHESEAARIAKEFEQVGLADVEFHKEKGEPVEVLRLHDSVYEFAMFETGRRKEKGVGHKTVVKGYGKSLKKSGGYREWWSKDLEDDNYIHRNVCRHLMGAGLEDELFGLLLSPKWLERQVELNGVAFVEEDFSFGIGAIQKLKEKARDVDNAELEEALEMMREAITLSSSYILKNEELWFQVHGRLKKARECNKVVRENVRKIESDARKPGVLCMNELLVQPGGANARIIHIGSDICCMVLLKDGERVACGCLDGDIAIVNVHRSEIEVRWRAHEKWVNAIDIGKGGTRIVSGSSDRTAKVWDVESCECVATFEDHSEFVTYVAITEDGKRVVSGTSDGTVQVWDTEGGLRVGPSINVDSMECLTVFRDGEHVVMGRWQRKLKIWNIMTNEKVGASFDGHKSNVRCAVLTADESRLVTGSRDHTVRLWDVETRQQVGDPFEGHTGGISCVAMSDDGRRVVSGSYDRKICVWDMETREQVCEPLIGHTEYISGVSFLGESDTIVSCSEDGTVRAWNLKRKRKETSTADKHREAVTGVSFTPDGRYVVSGSRDGTLRVWDAISGQGVGEPLMNEDSSHVNGVVVTPDGRFALSVSDDESVRVWDLQTREVVSKFEGHTNAVYCVAVTPNGERAVTGSEDRTVRVWDLKSMDGSHFVLEWHRASLWRVYVSDDGKRIISMDDDANIIVWDIETRMVTKRAKKRDAWEMSRRKVLRLAGEATVHDEAGLSTLLEGNEIVHGEGSEARVLGTLESSIWAWDVSPDKQTICVGLSDGRVGVLKLHL